MAQTANPYQGMSPSELKLRHPDLYPATPTLGNAPSPINDGLSGLSPNDLAKRFPQFYPDGPGSRIPDMPKPEPPDATKFASPADLRRNNPQFYDPPPPPTLERPVSKLPATWNVPDSFTGVPKVPVESPPGLPLGFLASPAGAGVLGGALAGVMGIASGQPLEVAAGEALGTGLGTYGGALLGAPFGPAGVFIGGYLGGAIGGSLGRQLGQSIHDAFHPPDSINQGPNDMVPLPRITPFGRSGRYYTVFTHLKGQNNNSGEPFKSDGFALGGPFPGPILAVGFEPATDVQRRGAGTGANYIICGSPAGKRGTGLFDFGPHGLVYESLSITRVVDAGSGEEVPGNAFPSNFEQSPQPYPRMGGLPLVGRMPPANPQTLPPTLPQSQPTPTPGPKREAPAPANTPTPHLPTATPTPTTPTPSPTPTPTPTPTGDPSTPGGAAGAANSVNLNNLPGLFGLPFIPAVMPTNRTSPPGSLDLDPGNGPTGTGKPPKAPTNSPCSGACQRAIEGRIQGVDDKMGKLLQGANNAGQDAALAAILARLAVIDAKLGAQATGGISGFLSAFSASFDRLAKWLHLDRILNVLTFATTLHNAYMLSNALTQTLFSMFSNVLAAVGIKDKEGSPLEVGSIIGKTVENFAKSILGVEAVDGFKKEWKKYSRIYQAAANIVYSIQSIAFSILSALEVIGSMVGKIGNALKAGGAIFEKAFGWMNIQPNFQNRFFTNIQAATELVSNIDSVAGEVLSIEEATKNLGDQKKELDKALSEQEANDNKDQKKAKDANAAKPAITPENEQKPEA